MPMSPDERERLNEVERLAGLLVDDNAEIHDHLADLGREQQLHGLRLDMTDRKVERLGHRLNTVIVKADKLSGQLDTVEDQLDAVDGKIDSVDHKLDEVLHLVRQT